MLQFRLKNGQVVKVKPEHLEKFKEKYPNAVAVGDSGSTDEELLTGNFQNDAAEGAATVSGPKQEAPEDTEYKPENISSDLPKSKPNRYIEFKNTVVYEDEYLETKAGKPGYPETFDEYAAAFKTKPKSFSAEEVVVDTTSSKEKIEDLKSVTKATYYNDETGKFESKAFNEELSNVEEETAVKIYGNLFAGSGIDFVETNAQKEGFKGGGPGLMYGAGETVDLTDLGLEAIKARILNPETGEYVYSEDLEFESDGSIANSDKLEAFIEANKGRLNVPKWTRSKNKLVSKYKKWVNEELNPIMQREETLAAEKFLTNDKLFEPIVTKKTVGGYNTSYTYEETTNPHEEEISNEVLRLKKKNPNASADKILQTARKNVRQNLYKEAINEAIFNTRQKFIESSSNKDEAQGFLYAAETLVKSDEAKKYNEHSMKSQIAEESVKNDVKNLDTLVDVFAAGVSTEKQYGQVRDIIKQYGVNIVDADKKVSDKAFNKKLNIPENSELPENFYNVYKAINSSISANISVFEKEQNKATKSIETISDLSVSMDATAKNYELGEKYAMNVALGFSDIAVGTVYLGANILTLGQSEKLKNFGAEYSQGVSDIRDSYVRDVSFDDAFSSDANVGKFIAQEITNQIPILVAMMASGGAASAVIGMSSMGGKMMEMENEVATGNADYSNTEIWLKSLGYGVAEAGFAQLTTVPILRRAKTTWMNAGKEQVVNNSFREYLKSKSTGLIYEPLLESAGEIGTVGAQNLIDGRPVTSGMDHAGASGAAFGFAFAALPFLKGAYNSKFSTYESRSKVRDLKNEINDLGTQLDAKMLSKSKAKIRQQIAEKTEELNMEIQKQDFVVKNKFNSRGLSFISNIIDQQADLENQAREVQNDKTLSREDKIKAIKDIKAKYDDVVKIKEAALSEDALMANEVEWRAFKGINKSKHQQYVNEAKSILASESSTGQASEAAVNVKAYELYFSDVVRDANSTNSKAFGNFKSFETKAEGIEYLNSFKNADDVNNANIDKAIEGISRGNDGVAIRQPDGRRKKITIAVVENQVANQRKEVRSHEVNHQAVWEIFKDTNFDGAVKGMSDQILSNLKSMDKSLYNSLIKDLGSDINKPLEVIARFTEKVASDEIKYRRGSKVKGIASLFGVMAHKEFHGKYDFDFRGENDIFNFVVGLGKKIKSGELTMEDIKAAREGAVVAQLKDMKSGDAISDVAASEARISELQEELQDLDIYDFDFDEDAFNAAKSNIELKIRRLKSQSAKPKVKVSTPKEVDPLAKKIKEKAEVEKKKDYNNEELISKIKDKTTSEKDKRAAEKELTDSFDAMALDAIKYDKSKGDIDMVEVRDYLRQFLPSLIEKYDPSKAKFSTMVYTNMGPKAQQTYQRFLKIADKSLDVAAGETGSVKEIAAQETSTTQTVSEKKTRTIDPVKLMGSPETQTKYTKSVRKAVESGNIDLDGLTFGNLNDLAPEVTAELFDIPLLKVTDPADNLTKKDVVVDASNIDKIKKYYPDAKLGMVIPSEAGKIRNWLKRNITEFRAILPSENVAPELATFDAAAYVFVKGTGLKIPPSLLKSLYEATGQRSKGKTSQVAIKKLKNLSDAQVLELFGIVKGQEAKYDRVIGQRLKAVTTLIGKLATNAEVRKIENISDIAIQNIAAGKSDVMFSSVKQSDIINAFNKGVIGQNLSKDVVRNIITNIDTAKDIKGLMKLINNSVKNTLGVKGRRQLEVRLLSVLAKSNSFEDVLKEFQKDYRKLYKYEYGVVGYNFVKDKLTKNFNEAKSKKDKIKIVKDFLLYESRSIRTGKIDGLTTNKAIFDNIIKQLDAKELGFKLVTNRGRTYIYHDGIKLQGLMDITNIKQGFTESTVEQMTSEADATLDYLLNVIEGLDPDLATGYLALSSIDQRGILRKLSRPGFAIQGVEGKMILEHETEALSIHNKIMEFVNGDIIKTDLVKFIKDSKVNLIPKSLDNVLNADPKLRDKARYERSEFKDALNTLLSQDDVVSVGDVNFSSANKLSDQFNRIIQNATGIDAKEVYSKDKASVEGANKGKFKFFIPPSAEDFVGLLYATLGKGKLGDVQMAWYKKHVIDTYSKAMNNITNDRVRLGKAFKEIKKQFKTVPKNLKGKIKDTNFTKEHAVRAWIWTQLGEEIPGFSEADIKPLVDFVNTNEDIKAFAEEVMKLNPGFGYAKPGEGWTAGTISTDMISVINDSNRKGHLELWQQNVDQIFSKENLNKLEAAYGIKYRKAMENVLARMKAGKNRIFATDTAMGRWTEWLNGSVGAIMFFNTRSAVLQTISSINFMNWSDNNPLMAAKAFANQPQYWKDFKKLFNSEFLLDRRDGLKINVSESEIADIAKNQGVRGLMAKLLKLGFTPTQIADSFAIASGGASFYRNRIKTYIKDGMDPTAAEKQAMIDFRENAEESQQSSRPDKISQQQAGGLGRVILAFANTPSQYARIMKKAAQDLKNGRGDAKTNISKILYYGALQNLLFTTLQNAAFGIIFGDEEDDEKVVNMANGAADTLLRGTGVYGAIVSTVKNALLEIYKQEAKDRPDYNKVVLQVARISPPLGSKLQKATSAADTFSKKRKDIEEMGYDIDNPAVMASANAISAFTNFPADRLIKKLNNLEAMTGKDVSDMQRLALLAGWSEVDLGISEWQKERDRKAKQKEKENGRLKQRNLKEIKYKQITYKK